MGTGTKSAKRRYKGCAMCSVHRDDGQAKRQPVAVLRKIGRNRRIRRHEVWGA